MEKQKAQMRVEERDRRAEELKNQMINVIPEEVLEEPSVEEELPFEIPGVSKPKKETVKEETPKEKKETPKEEKTEKKEKKKTDKQVSLFSF